MGGAEGRDYKRVQGKFGGDGYSIDGFMGT